MYPDDDFDDLDRDFDEGDGLAPDDFAEPGGRSALRAAGPGNPRDLPCPTCGTPDTLTAKDVAHGYQCNACADSDEGRGP